MKTGNRFARPAGLIAGLLLMLAATGQANAQQAECTHLGGALMPSGADAATARWWVNAATTLDKHGVWVLKFFPAQPGSNGHWFQQAANASAAFRQTFRGTETLYFEVRLQGVTTPEFCSAIRSACRPNPMFTAQLPCF